MICFELDIYVCMCAFWITLRISRIRRFGGGGCMGKSPFFCSVGWVFGRAVWITRFYRWGVWQSTFCAPLLLLS